MSSSKTRTEVGVIVLLASGVAVATAERLRRRRTVRPAAPAQHPVHRCGCGREYEYLGQGAHQVYWPAGGTQRDALLGDACECGQPLRAEAPVAA